MVGQIVRLFSMCVFVVALSNLASYLFHAPALDWWTGLWKSPTMSVMAWQTAVCLMLLSSCIVLLSFQKNYVEARSKFKNNEDPTRL